MVKHPAGTPKLPLTKIEVEGWLCGDIVGYHWRAAAAKQALSAIALQAEVERKDAEIARLLEALLYLIPVAEETCKRWPNDDCYLRPTAHARIIIAATAPATEKGERDAK